MWTAISHGQFGIRAAGAGPLFAYGAALTDVALLGGMRATSSPESSPIGGGTASFAIGPSIIHGFTPLDFPSSRKLGASPALAYNVEGVLHLRVIGVGFTGFGAVGVHAMYSAFGITLSLGKIH